ncbi:MAG: DUF1697 domain-containing protein [Candidatus Thorarchaeota archaeon]|jgi:uncharacterized protein (DUF1697 family)
MMFVAFLRGINVGGRNLLKMQDVRQSFTELGFVNVSSYKASGNILFETEMEPEDIVSQVKGELRKLSGKDLEVFLRTSSQIKGIIELAPFKGRNADQSKLYVTFILDLPVNEVELPLWSRNRDVEIILSRDCELFSQTFQHKGRYGAPNKLVEKEFNQPATTRNWNTLIGIHERIIRDYS